MQGFDPRITKLFQHIRQAIDLLEQVLNSPTRTTEKPMDAPKPVVPLPMSTNATKFAYSVEEVRKIVGISRSAIYNAINARELQPKRGRRTIVLASDLHLWLDRLPSMSGPENLSR